MRGLILGMDQKLKLQEEKLQGMLAHAKAEGKKYDELVTGSGQPTRSRKQTLTTWRFIWNPHTQFF
jgi:hypothetical protein